MILTSLPLENSMLVAAGLHKTYRGRIEAVHVLNGVDFELHPREMLGIIGASGSGKSTLLHLLGLLDQPDKGEIRLDGERIDDLPSRDREHLRNQAFGFVFQFYHLLPELSALENVMVPTMVSHSLMGWLGARRQLKRRAEELLCRVGLEKRMKHRPRELSGGEMQRTAIARALMCHPRVLLADEPTGNLDEGTGREIVQVLRDLNRDDGMTIVLVTHNMELAAGCDRLIKLVGGRVENPTLAPVNARAG